MHFLWPCFLWEVLLLVEFFNFKLMPNPDQKTILLEQAYEEIKVICTKFQDESGATDMEVKTLLRELARVWEKDIDEDYDIDWEV